MKCFYHSADLDGRCSGAIVKMSHPECEMIGINYGEPFPWDRIEPGEFVYMVDFSLPLDDMERLNAMCALVWVDHHKSAIEEAQQRGFVASGQQVLAIGTAGCELTWDLFGEPEAMPQSVFLLGRYDVWDHHNHPGALEFQYGMRQFNADPNNQEFWRSLFCGDINGIIDLGRSLLAYEERQNEMYCQAFSFETELDGLRCIAVNKGLTNSLLFKTVYDPDKHDAMVSFVKGRHGWKVSVYTDKPGVDASALCKARGGGGHKGAAGFQCEMLPF